MRAVVAVGALLVAWSAWAGEPLRFVPPSGWTVDAEKAKAVNALIFAADERTQPTATMIGLRMDKSMPSPDEALVRGFIAGARKKAPSLVEVRHDFVDIAGARAARVICDLTVDGDNVRQAYYLMPSGDATALLLVSDAREAFDARLLEFDEIARVTRGLAASSDLSSEEVAYRAGLVVGRVLGTLLLLVAIFFAIRFVTRALNKPRS
jgi:hypothetical protein